MQRENKSKTLLRMISLADLLHLRQVLLDLLLSFLLKSPASCVGLVQLLFELADLCVACQARVFF